MGMAYGMISDGYEPHRVRIWQGRVMVVSSMDAAVVILC